MNTSFFILEHLQKLMIEVYKFLKYVFLLNGVYLRGNAVSYNLRTQNLCKTSTTALGTFQYTLHIGYTLHSTSFMGSYSWNTLPDKSIEQSCESRSKFKRETRLWMEVHALAKHADRLLIILSRIYFKRLMLL